MANSLVPAQLRHQASGDVLVQGPLDDVARRVEAAWRLRNAGHGHPPAGDGHGRPEKFRRAANVGPAVTGAERPPLPNSTRRACQFGARLQTWAEGGQMKELLTIIDSLTARRDQLARRAAFWQRVAFLLLGIAIVAIFFRS